MYNRYRPYSSQRFRARSNQRAANQQRDSTQVVINTSISTSCGQNYIKYKKLFEKWRGANKYFDEEYVWNDTGCAAINIYDVLRRSSYFQSYANMYDQVKIDSIQVKIIATNWQTGDGKSDGKSKNEYIKPRSLVVVSAWDLTGLSESQYDYYWNPNKDLPPEVPNNMNNVNIFYPIKPEDMKVYCTVGKSIQDYSSAQTKHLGPGNTYEITRYCLPKTLIEKAQYVQTSLLTKQYNRSNSEGFAYKLIGKQIMDRWNSWEYNFKSKYPTNLLEDPAISFKPTLLLNVIADQDPEKDVIDGEEVGINQLRPVDFALEFNIAVTFRSLRYSKII